MVPQSSRDKIALSELNSEGSSPGIGITSASQDPRDGRSWLCFIVGCEPSGRWDHQLEELMERNISQFSMWNLQTESREEVQLQNSKK